MELDELKKQWNALDHRLQQTPITRTDEVERLIARCRRGADSGVRKLRTMQVVSLGIGVAMVVLAILGAIGGGMAGMGLAMVQKHAGIIGFMAITLIAGFAWDWKTYRHLRALRVDTMPVVEVSRRMAKLAQWTRYEMWAMSVWALAFCLVFYLDAGYPRLSAGAQLCYWIFTPMLIAIGLFLLYKRINKHIAHVRKNLKELEDVCTESH